MVRPIGGSNTAFGSGAIGLSGKIGVANGISLANNITLSGSAAQVFADTGNSGTFAGVISGAQPLSKAGAGTLTLSGASTYSGSTSVTAGTLAVTGSIVNTSTLTVASGGTLTGSGTVGTVATAGTVTVQSGGTLAPGVNGPGTLTLNQGLTVASGGTLAMQLNGATAGTGFDQLVVKGAVSLTGASLTTSLGYSPGGGDSFTLIDNDGTDAVVGTFSGLAEGATINLGGTNYIISYVGGTGNDVVVSFPPNAVPTLVSFAAAVATASEDTQKEITLTNLAAQGNEADSDGTVTGFVVQAVSTGTLKIGTSAVAATAWDANTNNTA
ncbi:MAG: autotransporter-associated beta strand repeat-containing protein [Betaproteobacteria bacterium]|nr:autotransporter-associated beta strand repeat-containing protein [Betaproteobacteria bacterium]